MAAGNQSTVQDERYRDPDVASLPTTGFAFDGAKAALVVVDPQNDFLTEGGVAWALVGESVVENDTVANIGRLFGAAKGAGLPGAISPHYYYHTDHDWNFGGPSEHLMHDIGMFDRAGPLKLDGFERSGADFLDIYKPYILDDKTIIASPHKVFGPETNDLVLQLRKKGVSQVILAGMAANLCIESHLRELREQGFEVAVVRDATAGPRTPEGDGYLAAIINDPKMRRTSTRSWSQDGRPIYFASIARQLAEPAGSTSYDGGSPDRTWHPDRYHWKRHDEPRAPGKGGKRVQSNKIQRERPSADRHRVRRRGA